MTEFYNHFLDYFFFLIIDLFILRIVFTFWQNCIKITDVKQTDKNETKLIDLYCTLAKRKY